MGILVNEFASRLIRQPYFSRISNRSCFGTRAALPAVGRLAGSTDFSGCADVSQDESCIYGRQAGLTREHPLGSSSSSEPEDREASLLKVG